MTSTKTFAKPFVASASKLQRLVDVIEGQLGAADVASNSEFQVEFRDGRTMKFDRLSEVLATDNLRSRPISELAIKYKTSQAPERVLSVDLKGTHEEARIVVSVNASEAGWVRTASAQVEEQVERMLQLGLLPNLGIGPVVGTTIFVLSTLLAFLLFNVQVGAPRAKDIADTMWLTKKDSGVAPPVMRFSSLPPSRTPFA